MSIPKNPFVGLRPFESEDSLYYFGRNEQTMELLKYLYQTHFLAVVGSSGSGKSSLVRAGLIPNLEAGFLVQDRDLWHIAIMKPGDRPLYKLAAALLQAAGDNPSTGQIADFAEAISDKGIHAVLKRIGSVLIEEDSNLFLVVDQFEEIFRFGIYTGDSNKREEASAFADLLLRLAEQDDIPVYVCLTMRSDYIGDCNAFPGLPEAMNRSQYLVPRLTRLQRREAIEGPIRLSGATIASRLMDRLLNESGENRDDLPVLQHALMRTWNEWAKDKKGSIDTIHYENIQTMKRALSRHADEALNELSGWEKHLAKRLFQTLTKTDAENRRIRRSAHLNEIADVLDAPIETVMRIIGKFREESRSFLVLSSESTADNPLVDISHESLMRQWVTLSDWMDEEAESAKIYKRLAEEAELYKQGKAGLYTDPALQITLDWEEKEIPSEAWGKRYHKGFERAMEFLYKSRTAREERIREEESKREEQERLLRAKADLMEKQARQRQKSLRQTRIFLIVISIFLVIAAVLTYLAIVRGIEAKRQALAANYNLAKVFEEKAINALKSKDYKHAWLYTAAALKQEIDKDKLPLRPDSAVALLTPGVINAAFSEKWFSPSVDFHTGSVKTVAFCPDGKTLASSSRDKTIRLWDVASGKEIRTLTGHSRGVNSVAFCPDGKTLASGSRDNTIRLWDVLSGKEIRTLTGHSNEVQSVAFCPDGKILASGSWDKTIRLWDVTSGKEIRTLTGHSELVNSVAFCPDGKILASGSWDKTIRLWDVFTGKEIRTITGHSETVYSVAFCPDGKILASGSSDNTIRLWDVSHVASGKEIRTLTGYSNDVTSVAFSPDGKTLASGSWDKTIRLWDVSTGKDIQTLNGHSDAVYSVAFCPDGKTLASGSWDKTIRLWDVANVFTGKEIRTLTGHSRGVNSVSFCPDGKTLASGSIDNSIRLWNVSTGKEIRRLKGHSDIVYSVSFCPDGKTLASGSIDNSIRLWDVSTGKEIRKLIGHSRDVRSVAFSPDGNTIASGSSDDTIRLWDMLSRKEISKLTGHLSIVSSVAFSPDGNTIASGSWDKTIRLWDVSTGKEIRKLTGHSGFINIVAFCPDGKTLASGSSDNTIRLWDAASGKEIRKLTGHFNEVNCFAFYPDGKTLASDSSDNTIRLWDVSTGKEILKLIGHSRNVGSVVFSPDGNTIASGSLDKTIRLWDISIFNLFLKTGKPTPLFYTFSEGAEFFWGVKLEGFEYKKRHVPTHKKFQPLLDPPAPGQTKFEQILEWAKKHQ